MQFAQAADGNETRPSAFGERIVPLIDQELKKKFEKAAALKEKEKGRKVSVTKMKDKEKCYLREPVQRDCIACLQQENTYDAIGPFLLADQERSKGVR